MPKTNKVKKPIEFGKRLAQLRKKAGLSQYDLADEMGVSQRVIAYYEGETDFPPTHLLPLFAKVFNVTTDELLGISAIDEKKKIKDTRLLKRFVKIEKFPAPEKKKVLRLLDTFIENEELKKQAKAS